MELNELHKDCSRRQKKGLHFILASVVIWALLLAVHLTHLTIEQKNLITFCCSAVLFPLAWGLSNALNIDFKGEGNPLTKAGILFSVNQILYILIAMWMFAAVPDKMSIVIPILSLVIGLMFPPFVLAGVMMLVEAVFSLLLYRECKSLR